MDFCIHEADDMAAHIRKSEALTDLVPLEDWRDMYYWVWDYDLSRREPTWWIRCTGWEKDLPLSTREAEAVCLGMWLTDYDRAEQNTDHFYNAVVLGETHS